MPDASRHLDLIFQWEVRTWSRAYALWHQALLAAPGQGGRALALGERDGGLSLMLAEHGFDTVCSDLRGPTPQAMELHRAQGVSHRVSYAHIDTLAIPEPDHSFEVVAFKSMIGALGSREAQRQAILEMHRVLRPGVVLLFAENLTVTGLHRSLRQRFVAWHRYWRYLELPEDRALFDVFDALELHTTGLLANLGRSEGQRDLLARFDALVMPLVPASNRTMAYGVARKGLA
jgi:SAM-dependent methyltransferase